MTNGYIIIYTSRKTKRNTQSYQDFLSLAIKHPSPVYKQANKSFNSIKRAIKDIPIYKGSNESKLEIEFNNGTIIKFMSAESDDNLRGGTFTYLVCDEFAFIKKELL